MKKSNHLDMGSLLETRDRREQARRVQELLRQAGAPVLEMVIRVDLRSNQITLGILGGQLSYELAYRMLDTARDELRRQEMEELRGKEKALAGDQGG